MAYERIERYVRPARMGETAAGSGALSAAAGAILGAAIAVVAGTNVAEGAGKGAAAGAAVGIIMGGAEGYGDPGSRGRIYRDLGDRGLEDKSFGPRMISHGFLFFPVKPFIRPRCA